MGQEASCFHKNIETYQSGLLISHSLMDSSQLLLLTHIVFFFLGSDIMMQLDDVVSSTISGPRVEEAMFRF